MTKSTISGRNPHIGTGTKSGYGYPLYRGELVPVPLVGVPVPIHQRGNGTGTEQGGCRYQSFQQPCFCTPCTIKSRIHTLIV